MKELEQYFKALGDNNRLRIINLLLHGELCVCDIQYVLENSQPNVSRHLSYLKNSGMVLAGSYAYLHDVTNPERLQVNLEQGWQF
jgi:ArsR family transcriptional regulator